VKYLSKYNENLNSEYPEYQNDIDHVKEYIIEIEDGTGFSVEFKSCYFTKDCRSKAIQWTNGRFFDDEFFSDSQYIEERAPKKMWFPGFAISIPIVGYLGKGLEELCEIHKNLNQFEVRLRGRFRSGGFHCDFHSRIGSKTIIYNFNIHTSSIDGEWKILDYHRPG
jgi:hypothetical protein